MSRSIAVFMPNWIGDAVMATPTLRALRHHAGPAGKLVGIMQWPIAALLAGTNWFDEIRLREGADAAPGVDWRAFARRLRRAGFDLSIHLTNDFASALAARLGGVPQRAGYVANRRGWLLTERLQRNPAGGAGPRVSTLDAYRSIARAAGCDVDSARMELATTPAEEALADRAWASLGLAGGERPVVLNSSGRYGPAKRWPERHCAALASRIARDLGLPVVVLAGPAERESAARIAEAAAHSRVASIADPRPSIGLSKACVKRSRCLVSTDSGPRHLGAAFGVPVVALFGPTDPALTDTRHDGEVRLAVPMDCRPCQRRECPLGHHACMEQLDVESVFAAVARAIGGRPDPSAGSAGSAPAEAQLRDTA